MFGEYIQLEGRIQLQCPPVGVLDYSECVDCEAARRLALVEDELTTAALTIVDEVMIVAPSSLFKEVVRLLTGTVDAE